MGTKSTKTSTVYGNTTTSNPYAYAHTDNSGTKAGFQNGTALQSVYDFVNKNINSVLNDYLTPNLNSVTNQAKLKSFSDNLNQQARNQFENNIINPLSKRNMIRSSQATDMYNNLNNQNIAALSNYINDLISNSQNDSGKMLSNLLATYMLGANYLTSMQGQSLQTSAGNATRSVSGADDIASTIVPLLIKTILTN